jgi:hypothetical protein
MKMFTIEFGETTENGTVPRKFILFIKMHSYINSETFT